MNVPTVPLDLSIPHRLHVVGVGGPGMSMGMSAIAIALAEMGHDVSGSDLREHPVLERVRAARVTVSIGHDRELVHGVDAVTASTAIPDRHSVLLFGMWCSESHFIHFQVPQVDLLVKRF
jgi:UDP-N-acetylmuramate--alanine ligase